MVGYHNGGYRLWDYEADKTIISTDVIFDETHTNFESCQAIIVFNWYSITYFV